MASFNPGFYPAPSHTQTHFLESTVYDGVHPDLVYDVDSAFIRMNLDHSGPGSSPGPRAGYSSNDTRLHFEQELLKAQYVAFYSSLALEPPPSSVLDHAAMYAYGAPASLSSMPEPNALSMSEDEYYMWYINSAPQAFQTASDFHQDSATGVDLWPTTRTIPVQSAYSTIADALGCCPADVYAPAPPPTSTRLCPQRASGRNAESTTNSRKRTSSRICAQVAPASSPSPSSYSSSSATSPTPSHGSSSQEVISTPRRNTAVAPDTRPARSANPWKCPFCAYVQHSRRTPDLKRHIKTHTRVHGSEDFKCCGVPLADAAARGVPAAVMSEEPRVYQGIAMV
ncbi:hypothetical protein TRAPUB_2452, partial [Trametes pubescens]